MDNGQFLLHDGDGHVRRLLALLRRPPDTLVGNCSLLFCDWRRSSRRCFKGIQCCRRSLPPRLGILAVYNLGLHAQNKHGFRPYFLLCVHQQFSLFRRVLEGCHWGLFHGYEAAACEKHIPELHLWDNEANYCRLEVQRSLFSHYLVTISLLS